MIPTFGDIPAGRVKLPAGGYLVSATTITLPPFQISIYPITNCQFGAFIAAGGYANEGWWSTDGWKARARNGWQEPRYWLDADWNRPEQPIVGVSWFEAEAYCRWLSGELGATARLPTEAEWQRAAQGDDERRYPWGSDEPDETHCNWQRRHDGTTPVDQFPAGASPFGIMDMSGNVWEWTATGWENGDRPDAFERRLLRGGAWSSDSAYSLTVSNRSAHDPNNKLRPAERNLAAIGFRVALNA